MAVWGNRANPILLPGAPQVRPASRDRCPATAGRPPEPIRKGERLAGAKIPAGGVKFRAARRYTCTDFCPVRRAAPSAESA